MVIIFSIIAVVGFVLRQMLRNKADSLLISQIITVNEEKVKALGLYPGMALYLSRSEEKNVVLVWASDAVGNQVMIGNYSSPIEYDILRKRDIHALVYSIYGEAVTVEIKLNEAL